MPNTLEPADVNPKKKIHLFLIAVKDLKPTNEVDTPTPLEVTAGPERKMSFAKEFEAHAAPLKPAKAWTRIRLHAKLEQHKVKTDLLSPDSSGVYAAEEYYKFHTRLFKKAGAGAAGLQPKVLEICVVSETHDRLGSLSLPLNSISEASMEPVFKPLGGIAECGTILFNCFTTTPTEAHSRRKSYVQHGELEGSGNRCSRKVSTPFAPSMAAAGAEEKLILPYAHPASYAKEASFRDAIANIDYTGVQDLDPISRTEDYLFLSRIYKDAPAQLDTSALKLLP